jgi:DNA-directed RNA polymerase II subunit RPB1
LLGVTENIIIGNLAPLGTGCFDLKIDPECILKNVQASFPTMEEEAVDGGRTPIQFDEGDIMVG